MSDIETLFDQLVPFEGKCESLAGEMVRAAARLRYDFYNNGMGNNTSGALNFLRHHSVIDKQLADYVRPYTTGRLYDGVYEGDFFQVAIDTIVEMTEKFVTSNPQTMTIDNATDMFEFSDDDLEYEEYFDEDEEDY